VITATRGWGICGPLWPSAGKLGRWARVGSGDGSAGGQDRSSWQGRAALAYSRHAGRAWRAGLLAQSGLEPIARTEPPVSLTGTESAERGAKAVHHLPEFPSANARGAWAKTSPGSSSGCGVYDGVIDDD
jgi:hypothetical protein